LSAAPDQKSFAVAPPGGGAIDLLIVDDSLVARSVLERILSATPATRVAGSVASVKDALAFLATRRVDVVILDIEMPDRTGLDGLPELLAAADGARILVVSALAEENGPAAVAALAAGACDALPKPGRRGYAGNFASVLVERILQVAARGQQEAGGEDGAAAGAQHPAEPDIAPPRLIAIGGSTGAIGGLTQLLTRLDAGCPCPVLITQHLPAQFIPYFADQLKRSTGLSVTVARDGERARAGHVYLAPGDRHLGCRVGEDGIRLELFEGEFPVRYTPAVDAMFQSVSEALGPDVLAIVLSGMGRDGCVGARRLVDAGGTVVAQDAATSVVWGMPGAVVRSGIAHYAAEPVALADFCNRVCAR
jgi:two-component system chemotaxis response regulator CheB